MRSMGISVRMEWWGFRACLLVFFCVLWMMRSPFAIRVSVSTTAADNVELYGQLLRLLTPQRILRHTAADLLKIIQHRIHRVVQIDLRWRSLWHVHVHVVYAGAAAQIGDEYVLTNHLAFAPHKEFLAHDMRSISRWTCDIHALAPRDVTAIFNMCRALPADLVESATFEWINRTEIICRRQRYPHHEIIFHSATVWTKGMLAALERLHDFYLKKYGATRTVRIDGRTQGFLIVKMG